MKFPKKATPRQSELGAGHGFCYTERMQPKIIEKYFFFGLLFAAFVFVFLIFRPFWIVLILGFSFSVIFYPLYARLNKRKIPNWLAAIITLFFFIGMLCVPLFGIGTVVFNQSQNLYHSVVNNGDASPFINSLGSKINQILPNGISFNINEQVSNFISFLTNNIAGIMSATASILFSFILLLLTIFYFLKDGEKWKETILRLSPLSSAANQKIIDRLVQTINGVIKGYLLVAFIQGILVGIGLAIFHVPNPAIWAVLAGIASIIPPMGTAIISAPAIIFLLTARNIGGALGLLIWSVLIVGMGDNLLNPYIIGHRINIPPFLILFSALGGITLLGPVGILIGPLAVSMLHALTEIYQKEFKQITS